MAKLKAIDVQIINILKKNVKARLRQIAEACHSSTSAIQRRIKSMEEEGIIKYSLCVDYSKMGFSLFVVSEVFLENHSAKEIIAFREKIRSCPYVRNAVYVSGESDFLVFFQVKDINQYKEVTEEIFDKNVLKYRSIFCLDDVDECMSIRPDDIY